MVTRMPPVGILNQHESNQHVFHFFNPRLLHTKLYQLWGVGTGVVEMSIWHPVRLPFDHSKRSVDLGFCSVQIQLSKAAGDSGVRPLKQLVAWMFIYMAMAPWHSSPLSESSKRRQ